MSGAEPLAPLARRAEVAVVGAGIVGLAAADALRRRGAEVRCFEVGEPGAAQSGGLTRIFRHRHAHDELVALALDARAAWRSWEHRAGRRLLGQEGVLHAGASEDDADRLRRAGLRARWLSPEGARAVMPALDPPSAPLLFDPDGGALRIARAVRFLVAELGERLVRAEVLAVREHEGKALVDTPSGPWRCRHVLLCAGAGTARLAAPLGLALPVRLEWQARPAFRVRPGGRTDLPALIDTTGEHGERTYASPVGSSGRYAVGLSGPDGKQLVDDLAAPPDHERLAAGVERVCGYVTRALPGLDPTPESVRICGSTLLDLGSDSFAAWPLGPVTAFAGSNLAKFAPILGERLADAALEGRVPVELGPPSVLDPTPSAR